MFRKFAELVKSNQPAGENDAESGGKTTPPVGNITKMLSASGRISFATLQKASKVYDEAACVKFMQQPAIVGSAILAGKISAQAVIGDGQMNSTQLFEPSVSDTGSATASESLKHAIYPLIKNEYATTDKRVFYVGRVEGNDMIMPDFAISKQHAAIEIGKKSYTIRDCGSTNGTMLNGKPLKKKPVDIRDKDVISFARYEFTFLSPTSLYTMLQGL
jgi:hypothetical protein